MIKNNVTRYLEAKRIPFTAFELPVEKLGALETADLLKIPAGQVFKTIVVTVPRGGKPILAIIPGNDEVDLRRVADTLKEKKVTLPSLHEAEQITGLLAGGISPLALLNRGFQILLDDQALLFEEIHISGGQRGLNIRLRVKDLIDLTKARLSPITDSTGRNST